MFRMVFPDARLFTALLKAIAVTGDEAAFQITSESMEARMLDGSGMVLVDAGLHRLAADKWELDPKDPITLTISVSELIKVLDRSRRGELLTLEYRPEEEKVWLEMMDAKSVKRRIYVNALKEREAKEVALRLEFKAKAVLEPRALLEAIEDCKMFDRDEVRISIEPEMVSISSRGESGNALIKILGGGRLVYEIAAEEKVSAKYSVPHLERIMRAGMSVGDKMVAIELNDNQPMKISFHNPSVKLEYYVAPKVE